MPALKPSEARIVLRHYEDGTMRVLMDGKIIPGVVSASFSQNGNSKNVLNLSIIGLSVRLETSPHKRYADPDRQPPPNHDDASG